MITIRKDGKLRMHAGVPAPPPEPDPWKAELDKRIVRFLMRRGMLVSREANVYSWMDYEGAEMMRQHITGCEIGELTRWNESEWWEWGGTFDPDIRKQGIDLRLFCKCGEIAGRVFRYDEGYAALIRGLTDDAG